MPAGRGGGAVLATVAAALALLNGADAAPSAAMQQVLDRHNVYRCMHGLQRFVWNDAIAANAQRWAIQAGGVMRHSSPSFRQNVAGFANLGENIAQGVTDAQAIDLFYGEERFTHGGRVNRFHMNSGHYTQVVWRASTSVGCGVSGALLVCEYGPAGNVVGGFQANVNSPIYTKQQCGWTAPAHAPGMPPQQLGMPFGGAPHVSGIRFGGWPSFGGHMPKLPSFGGLHAPRLPHFGGGGVHSFGGGWSSFPNVHTEVPGLSWLQGWLPQGLGSWLGLGAAAAALALAYSACCAGGARRPPGSMPLATY